MPADTALQTAPATITEGLGPIGALPFPYGGAVWDALLNDLADRIAVRLAERAPALHEPPVHGPGELLTAREVCQLLQVSRSSLDRLVRQGHIEVRKIGAHNRYPRSSVDAYITRPADRGGVA